MIRRPPAGSHAIPRGRPAAVAHWRRPLSSRNSARTTRKRPPARPGGERPVEPNDMGGEVAPDLPRRDRTVVAEVNPVVGGEEIVNGNQAWQTEQDADPQRQPQRVMLPA